MTTTEPKNPSRPDAKGHSLILNVGVQVEKKGIPTDDFDLVDIDDTGLIHPRPKLEIDLSEVDQDVLIIFELLDKLGLQFPERADDCIGLNTHDHGCPGTATNAAGGLFAREGISMNRRQLAIRKKNIANGMHYLFALFLQDSADRPAAVCDPRIINR
jgi:hypothetical protein